MTDALLALLFFLLVHLTRADAPRQHQQKEELREQDKRHRLFERSHSSLRRKHNTQGAMLRRQFTIIEAGDIAKLLHQHHLEADNDKPSTVLHSQEHQDQSSSSSSSSSFPPPTPRLSPEAGPLAPPSLLKTASFLGAQHSICKGAASMHIRLVHIPKAGGMSLCCTYNNHNTEEDALTKKDTFGCGRVDAANIPVSLQGARHETYFEIARERNCSHDIVLPGGSNCAPTARCEPMIVMMNEPTARFWASFFQSFGETSTRGRQCGFLNCQPGRQLSSRYMGRSIGPSDFALWKSKDAMNHGFNEATKFLGLNDVFHTPRWEFVEYPEGEEEKEEFIRHVKVMMAKLPDVISSNTKRRFLFQKRGLHVRRSMPMEVVLTDDAAGRAALRTAKERLRHMDFVGLTSRFAQSMELLSWTFGVPLNQFCSCNVNAFKSPRYGQHASNMSEEARSAILSDNSLDKELYDYAVEIFGQRYAAFTAATEEREQESHGFLCDKGAMVCKSSKGWIPAQEYQLLNARAIHKGYHNPCTYKCRRKISDFPTPPAGGGGKGRRFSVLDLFSGIS